MIQSLHEGNPGSMKSRNFAIIFIFCISLIFLDYHAGFQINTETLLDLQIFSFFLGFLLKLLVTLHPSKD